MSVSPSPCLTCSIHDGLVALFLLSPAFKQRRILCVREFQRTLRTIESLVRAKAGSDLGLNCMALRLQGLPGGGPQCKTGAPGSRAIGMLSGCPRPAMLHAHAESWADYVDILGKNTCPAPRTWLGLDPHTFVGTGPAHPHPLVESEKAFKGLEGVLK